MELCVIHRKDHVGHDEYESCVIAHDSLQEAVDMAINFSCDFKAGHILIEQVGQINIKRPRIIHTSFNAG